MVRCGHALRVRDVFMRMRWFRMRLDDGGFSTLGMAIALVLSIALIVSGVRVYKVSRAGERIQEVADACALASEEQVARVENLASVCDALVFSLSMTSAGLLGLGIVSLCTPVTAPLSEGFLSASRQCDQVRERVYATSVQALNTLQKLLPVISAASAAYVAQKNSSEHLRYIGVSWLMPTDFERLEISDEISSVDVIDKTEEASDDIQSDVSDAERAAQDLHEIKERAYRADCGNEASSMYERAGRLAGLSGRNNPRYHSASTWDFSIAIKRARAYYQARQAAETPLSNTIAEKTRSSLRARYYSYALDELQSASAQTQRDGTYQVYMPHLFSSTPEFRNTDLFRTEKFFTSVTDEGYTIHALRDCPGNANPSDMMSLDEWERTSHVVCPHCALDVESMGSVAQASGHISNGFEYFYNEVARCAELYQEHAQKMNEKTQAVKKRVRPLLDSLKNLLSEISPGRIHINPPGSHGSVALVISRNNPTLHEITGLSFGTDAPLSTRVAIAGSGLARDKSEGDTLIADLTSKMGEIPLVSEAAAASLHILSSALKAYNQGISQLAEGIEGVLSQIPLVTLTGLGTWAKSEFLSVIESCGLEPTQLHAVKPVLVNTSIVVEGQDDVISSLIHRAKDSFYALDDEVFASGSIGEALVVQAKRTAQDTAQAFLDEAIRVEVSGEPIATFSLPPADSAKGG